MSNKRVAMFLTTVLGALCVLAPVQLQAGNPLLVDSGGRFVTWQSFPIQTLFDQGTLGNLSNSQAVSLVNQIFTRWQSVTTASLTFQNAGMTSQDITTSNFDSFRTCNPGSEILGKFAVVFDTDGSITDATFGAGQKNSVVGFAGPRCLAQNTQTGQWVINAATAVLNGFALTKTNPITQDDMKAVALHEFGHALGLDHTQLNGNLQSSFNPADLAAVPLMYPILTRNRPDPLGMTLDDQTEISALYPSASFSTTPSITGNVLLPDGQTPFQGANVIVRNVNDSNATAAANVSGTRFTASRNPPVNGSSDSQFKGKYEFFGLPAGNYSVQVESIESRFDDGSSVGPLDPPFPLPFPTTSFGQVAVISGSPTTQNLQLGQSQALPTLPILTIIPHFVIGGGYVTRVFVKNLANSNTNLIIQFMNQNGTVAQDRPQQTLTGGQTIQLSSGEANRTSTQSVQWIAMGSDGPISASVLFDCCVAGNQVTSATGVLAQSPGTSFVAPFIFQRETGTQPILAEGLGIANRSSSANTVTVQVLDDTGAQVSSDQLASLPAFGQTAIVVSDLPHLNTQLQGRDTFLGSLLITGTQQFSPVVVGNLGGKLFSLPLTAQ